MPGGWTLVAFAGNQNTACPTSTNPTDVYGGPSVANACSCACGSTEPTCPTSPISAYWTFSGPANPVCGNAGMPSTMKNASTCNTDMYTGSYAGLAMQYDPPLATGGECGSTSSQAPISYATSGRECTPATAPCTGNECTPSFGTGWQVCIAQAGSVACPTTTFTQQYVVGTSATYTCSPTGCSCAWKTTCSGTMELFPSNNCSGTPLDLPANGTCNDTNAGQFTQYGSYTYVPNAPSNVSCTASGTSTPDFTVTGQQTICCAP